MAGTIGTGEGRILDTISYHSVHPPERASHVHHDVADRPARTVRRGRERIESCGSDDRRGIRLDARQVIFGVDSNLLSRINSRYIVGSAPVYVSMVAHEPETPRTDIEASGHRGKTCQKALRVLQGIP